MNGSYYYEKEKENILARAYVPFQIMNQVYSPSEALKRGTLFPELYKPYKPGKKDSSGGGYYGEGTDDIIKWAYGGWIRSIGNRT